jgi:two-component system cell cycle sensor histidine kinase/response regulator CckA
MRSARVLVVEDERNIRLLVAAVLRQKGCQVVEAANGLEALHHLAQDERFDVVVTDLKMPELNGIALLSEMQRRYPDVPVVVMSAYVSEDWVKEAAQKTFVALPKPFTHSQLIDVLDQVLQRV